MRPTWFDLLIYRLYIWRWNPILRTRPDLRELLISYMKAFDTLNENEQIKITVKIEKNTNE